MSFRRPLVTAALGVDVEELRHKKANRTIPVHPEFRREMHKAECDRLLQDVRVGTGCIVSAYWDHFKIIKFDVFGGAGVEAAVGMLNDWIGKGGEKTKESRAWAKLPAYNENQWYYGAVQEMEDARKEVFKTGKPEGQFKGSVDWPEELRNLQITPRDTLGLKLEVLNPIRTQDEVFITLITDWKFEIQASEEDRVQAAEDHVLNVIKKVCAKQLGVTYAHNVVLDENEGINVALVEAESWWPNLRNKVVPRLLPSPMMYDPGSFRKDGLHPKQLFPIEQAIEAALQAVQYDRGSFDFAIRLGCLALSSKQMPDTEIGKTYSKETFKKSINGRVECDVKKWLVDYEVGEDLLSRFMAADDLLEPPKSASFASLALSDTSPTLRGTWVFQDPNSSIPEQRAPVRHPGRPAPIETAARNDGSVPQVIRLIVVQVEWTKDEDGFYEMSQARYYKLLPKHMAPQENMDINLLELGESRAWHFGLESMTPMLSKTVPPILKSFVKSVSLKRNYDTSSQESFAMWDRSPTVTKHLRTMRCDKIYTFGIRNTCYTVDLMAMWYPGRKEPCWGVVVHHTQWSFLLAGLENLPVGEGADWDDIIAKFLPDDGLVSCTKIEEEEELGMQGLNLDDKVEPSARKGIQILVGKLLKISKLVQSAQGGVSVGV